MSAFFGRISDGVELLGGRAVGAHARRVLRERRLQLGQLALEALDVLLGALDVVALLHHAARAARGARHRADRGRLAPEEAAEDRAGDRDGGLQARAALLVLLAVDRLLRPCAASAGAPRPSPRTSRAARRPSSRGPRARPARAASGSRPRTRRCARRASAPCCAGASPSASGRASRRSPSTSARSPSPRARAPAARGRLRPRAAPTRDPPRATRDVRRAAQSIGDRAVGERRQARVLDHLVDLVLGVEQPHARAAEQHRHVGQRRARRARRRAAAGRPARRRSGRRAARPPPPRCGGGRAERRGRRQRRRRRRGGGGGGRRRQRRLERRHQRRDLRPRERAAQVRHRPARLEHHGRVLVHVVQQEHAAAERRDQLLELRRGRGRSGPTAPSRPSSTRCLSRSVCRRPISHVPAFESPL